MRAASFRTHDDTSLTARIKFDRIGAFVHSMTGGSIPQAAIHVISGNGPGTKLFDLEPLYNDDGHIDYFVAPQSADALEQNTGYYVVFSEGGGSNASYKLHVTETSNEDDNSHPRWRLGNTGRTKDSDADSPSWSRMRLGDTSSGADVDPQFRIYAGVAE